MNPAARLERDIDAETKRAACGNSCVRDAPVEFHDVGDIDRATAHGRIDRERSVVHSAETEVIGVPRSQGRTADGMRARRIVIRIAAMVFVTVQPIDIISYGVSLTWRSRIANVHNDVPDDLVESDVPILWRVGRHKQ